jgi:hypothetical protein
VAELCSDEAAVSVSVGACENGSSESMSWLAYVRVTLPQMTL